MNNPDIYLERLDLIRRAIACEPVPRVPSIYMGTAFSPRYMGMTIAKFCSDPDAAWQVTLAAMDRLGGIDGCNVAAGGRITPMLSMEWMSRLAVPGRDLPDDALWQVVEAEVMTTADYDTILEQGWKPFLRGYLPRIIDPQELMEAIAWIQGNSRRMLEEYRGRGYVVVSDTGLYPTPPFEHLCGGRSMQKFYTDLMREPDRVEQVLQLMLEDVLDDIARAPQPEGIGGAWIGGWRTASALLSPKLWQRFVWPYIHTIVHALVDRGFTPVLHWDQDWTRDLEFLLELPAGKCILNPDGMTDMRRFKEITGDHMAMMGDVPSALLATGTPDDIRKYVHDLIELFEGQGLLLCAGCDAPINARPENVEAMIAAVGEH